MNLSVSFGPEGINVEEARLTSNTWDDMRPEYDMRGGVRGKYFDRYMVSRLRKVSRWRLLILYLKALYR